MTQRSLAVLIVLNAVLLAAIALTFGPVEKAQAQFGGGNYLMISGDSDASPEQVIYVMEANSGRVVAFTVNSASKKLTTIGARKIASDLEGGGGR